VSRCVAVLREGDDEPGGVILLTGSGGGSELFRQDLADATGLPVRYDPDSRDHSAMGAARFAGSSALDWPAMTEVPFGEERHPDARRAVLWRQRFARHEHARIALSGSHL
jgi:xylulokinase